ncbi:MAG TPA: hypothetical protein VFW94_10570 [Candidatus Acidoferrales bacterium]|nr:hypothetical protein [Candidatus Acidoferrales bacterium]
MLTIFGDESADSINQKAFAVAGLLGDESQWTALRKKWKERTGGKVFHASDCECDQNDFKGIPHADNLGLYKDLTIILAESGLMGFGAAIDLVGLRKYFSDAREENPYLSCFLRTVKYLGERAQQCIPSYEVEVIFNQHPTNEYNAGLIYQYLRMNQDWGVRALFAEKVSFASRKEIGIQAADLWAREIMKELENRMDSRPRRKSMLALEETHLFGADILLEGFYRGMRENYVKLSHELEMRPADYVKWLNNRQDNESNRILYMMFTEGAYQVKKSGRIDRDENSKDETTRGNA